MSVAAASGMHDAPSRTIPGTGDGHDEKWGRKMHQAFFHWNVLPSRSVPGHQSPHALHGRRSAGPDSIKSSHDFLSSSFWQVWRQLAEKKKEMKAAKKAKRKKEAEEAKKREDRAAKKAGWDSKKGLIFWFGWMVCKCFFWVVVFSLFKKQLLYSWTGKGGFGKEFHQEEEKKLWVMEEKELRGRRLMADGRGWKMWRYICHNLMLLDPCCKSAIAISFMFRDAVKVSIGRCKSVHKTIN